MARHGTVVGAAHAASPLTHFEILTALAYKHFAEEAVDVAVIETGLGGARDATNVLPAEGLRAAVLTAVGTDHAAALGGEIEHIAAAKAGIMKEGRPVVLARQPEPAAEAVLLHQGRLTPGWEKGTRRRQWWSVPVTVVFFLLISLPLLLTHCATLLLLQHQSCGAP